MPYLHRMVPLCAFFRFHRFHRFVVFFVGNHNTDRTVTDCIGPRQAEFDRVYFLQIRCGVISRALGAYFLALQP